jgi:tetratricopeptide (TPR) repeat protein
MCGFSGIEAMSSKMNGPWKLLEYARTPVPMINTGMNGRSLNVSSVYPSHPHPTSVYCSTRMAVDVFNATPYHCPMPSSPINHSPSTIRSPFSTFNPRLLGVLLVLATLLVYLPLWNAGFIWDDDDHLTENAAVQSPAGLTQIWSSLEISRYYPLTLTSFWAQYRLWGLRPRPYHLLNILLQAANACLLWTLLRRLHVPGAWLAAALWAIHPVNVETVAWITELKNTQSGLFLLLALLLFLRFEDNLRPRDYVLALLCGAAAMLSKPSTVILPLILLLFAMWRRRRCALQDLRRVSPLVIFAAGMSLLTVIEQAHHIASEGTAEWQLGFPQRLAIASRALWFYAGKILWPFNTCFVYPRWTLPTDSVGTWLPFVGLVLVIGLLWRFRARPWARPAAFALACFATALLPVLGFFNIYFFRYSFVADHFQYLASAALITLLVAAAASRLRKEVGPWIAAPVVAALAVTSFQRSATYASAETLYRATLARNPDCLLAYNNLGGLLSEQGRVDEALPFIQSALKLRPDDGGVYNNLGNLFYRQGKFAEAAAQYRQAIRLKPDYAEAHNNLATALLPQGQLAEAIDQYQQAVRIRPDYAVARYNLGNALVSENHLAEAIAQYQEAVRVKPDYAEAHSNLGNALLQAGRLSEAIAHAQQAVQLAPDNPTMRINLANALTQASRNNDAIAQYNAALRLAPDSVVAHFNLGNSLLRAGRTQDAIAQYKEALRLQPGFAPAEKKLAQLLSSP